MQPYSWTVPCRQGQLPHRLVFAKQVTGKFCGQEQELDEDRAVSEEVAEVHCSETLHGMMQ